MSGWTDFVHNLGFGKQQATKDAEENLAQSTQAYKDLQPPTLTPEHPDYATSYDQAPSAMGGISVDPSYKGSQVAQLEALKNLAANGGRNAASEANLARIQQGENANAKGQRDAILQNANARGMGGSGASLLAQLDSSQNATNNQSLEDLGVAGQEANTALSAGQGAASIGSNLENTDFAQQGSKAQAADAINRFNAGQKTGMSEYNSGVGNQAQQYNTGLEQQGYQNKFNKAAGIAGSNLAGVNFNQNQANMGAQQAGNLLGGAIKLGTAAGSGGKTGAARGGEVPGKSLVPGNSSLNDFVPINTSPHEVVVPVDLRQHGSKNEIANFVRHPPQIKSQNQDKEAMLSALSNLKRRRA